MTNAEPSVVIRQESDILSARRAVREAAAHIGLKTLGQTRLITATSELARNTLIYGGGGVMHLRRRQKADRLGITLIFEDQGPGIIDLDQAMSDGYSSGDGLGMGLGGAKRLMDEFDIESTPGAGTRIEITIWS